MTTTSERQPAPTVFELRQALIQQRAWVQHWQEDLAGNLTPELSSLQSALKSIDAALGNGARA